MGQWVHDFKKRHYINATISPDWLVHVVWLLPLSPVVGNACIVLSPQGFRPWARGCRVFSQTQWTCRPAAGFINDQAGFQSNYILQKIGKALAINFWSYLIPSTLIFLDFCCPWILIIFIPRQGPAHFFFVHSQVKMWWCAPTWPPGA